MNEPIPLIPLDESPDADAGEDLDHTVAPRLELAEYEVAIITP